MVSLQNSHFEVGLKDIGNLVKPPTSCLNFETVDRKHRRVSRISRPCYVGKGGATKKKLSVSKFLLARKKNGDFLCNVSVNCLIKRFDEDAAMSQRSFFINDLADYEVIRFLGIEIWVIEW